MFSKHCTAVKRNGQLQTLEVLFQSFGNECNKQLQHSAFAIQLRPNESINLSRLLINWTLLQYIFLPSRNIRTIALRVYILVSSIWDYLALLLNGGGGRNATHILCCWYHCHHQFLIVFCVSRLYPEILYHMTVLSSVLHYCGLMSNITY